MWLILFCSVIALMTFLERVVYFHRANIRVGEFLRGLQNLIQRRNFAEALHECAGTPGPVARVIHAAILRHGAPRTELKELVQEAGQLEVPKLERGLTLLGTVAYLVPMIGLLGTATGLIEAFVTVSAQSGYTSSTDIAKGIYQALLSTAAGLSVAVPCGVAYSYLSSRVNSLMRDMERGGIEIVNLIVDNRTRGDIIEFGASGERETKGIGN